MCTSTSCGEGLVDLGESCDDGNTVGGDGCNARCDKIEVCGDAVLDVGESCDDGNQNEVDGCSACLSGEWWATPLVVGAEASVFNAPEQAIADSQGNIFIADAKNHRIRRVDAQNGTVTTIAGTGESGLSGDGGPATSAKLYEPKSVVIDRLGNFYIASGNRIRRIDGQTGVISTVAGKGTFGFPVLGVPLPFSGEGGLAAEAEIYSPSSVAVDGFGHVYFSLHARICRIDAQTGILSVVAGTGVHGRTGDGGPAIAAEVSPGNLAFDTHQNLFFTQFDSIRRIDAQTGLVSRVAGPENSIRRSYTDDGLPALDGGFYGIDGLSLDLSGNIFLSTLGPELAKGYEIRKIDSVSGILSTVARPESPGLSEDDWPIRLRKTFVMPGGNVIANDRNRIHLVDRTTGAVSTLAGSAQSGYGGDGVLATGVSFEQIRGVAFDQDGNVIFSDKARIYRINDLDGTLTTVAGTGLQGTSEDGALATRSALDNPNSMVVNPQGDIYFGDCAGDRVRRIDASDGTIRTVAGYFYGFSGDGGPGVEAQLNDPLGLAFDDVGNLYIADAGNNRVRKIDASSGVITTVAGNGSSGFSGDGGLATDARRRSP